MLQELFSLSCVKSSVSSLQGDWDAYVLLGRTYERQKENADWTKKDTWLTFDKATKQGMATSMKKYVPKMLFGMVPKHSLLQLVNGSVCELWESHTLWGHITMPALSDVDNKPGKALLTSKPLKRRKEQEHGEEKVNRWDSWAWNTHLSTLESGHLWDQSMSAWCLWAATLSYSMLWNTVTPELPESMSIFYLWPFRILSSTIPWPSYAHKGKQRGESPVAFEIHLH